MRELLRPLGKDDGMGIELYVSLGALLLSAVSFFVSRRDKGSEERRQELISVKSEVAVMRESVTSLRIDSARIYVERTDFVRFGSELSAKFEALFRRLNDLAEAIAEERGRRGRS
jgi:hypothetical protein